MDIVAHTLQYVFASPANQPALTPLVTLLAHHLHCIMHSALTAGAMTVAIMLDLRAVCYRKLLDIDCGTHLDRNTEISPDKLAE